MASQQTTATSNDIMECPICYQECVHPVKLPCNHIFCYLCVKGVVTRNRNCAMCRTVVPLSYLENPEMVDKSDLHLEHTQKDEIQWFYQARRRGWWLHEKRIALELEQRYQEDSTAVFDLQIAGFLYTVDLENMEQYRKDDRNVSRAIKRDHIKHVEEVQGKAGIRLCNTPSNRTVEGGPTVEPPVVTRTTSPESTADNRRDATRNVPTPSPRSINQPVDITQLVANMNLLDKNGNSSDDEPESLV